ncbi:MAG: helix-turn-helix domain containing protein [Erysipelotrichaceae bacterium]|nr:helix-turn-helix domain containing protein [Erysipelotrichaceae bacterium]
MILKNKTDIKSILKISEISFKNPVCSKDVSRVTTYIDENWNKEISTHIHLSHDQKERDKICKFPNMKKHSEYSRSNITYVDGKGIVDEPVTVPVLYCKNCNHYHAILPSALIIPHYRYSIFFIFKVLYDKKYNHLSVNEIIEKYQIAVSTLYRWIERFLSYFRYYMYSRSHPKQEGMLEDILEDHEGVIRDICNFSSRTIMQLDRRLINSSGYSKNCT